MSNDICVSSSFEGPRQGIVRIQSNGCVEVFKSFLDLLHTPLLAQIHRLQIKPVSLWIVCSTFCLKLDRLGTELREVRFRGGRVSSKRWNKQSRGLRALSAGGEFERGAGCAEGRESS